MNRLGWTALLVLAALSVFDVGGSPAYAQTPGEEIARRTFEEGVALEKTGDYSGALAKFKESSQIKATLGNRFHAAYCLEMLGKLAAATVAYEHVESTAREQNKNDIVEATRARLEPLRARVPRLSVRAGARPQGLEVSLDGAAIPARLLDGEPFRIDPGEHTVEARAPEHAPFTKRVDAAEGATLSIDVSLAPATPAAAPAPATEAQTEEPQGKVRTLAIVTTAGAIALVGGGVGAYLAAGSSQSDGERSCAQKMLRTCDDGASTVRTLDAVALGAFIGAAGLAALSVVLWTSKASSNDAATSDARLVARPSWLGIAGSF